jgi:excisionase family DNA binding protein
MKIPTDAPTDRLWTVREVSYYLGVPVGTLYLWRSEGHGPPSRRVGRHLRYRAEDVKAWVEGLEGWTIPVGA